MKYLLDVTSSTAYCYSSLLSDMGSMTVDELMNIWIKTRGDTWYMNCELCYVAAEDVPATKALFVPSLQSQFSLCDLHEKEVAAYLETATSSKVGRNDPCPCKSGKKFKKCHG